MEEIMSEQQISKLTGSLVEHQRHFGQMSAEDRQWVIQNTTAAIALFAEAMKNRASSVVKKILILMTTVKVAAVEHFVAAEKFREGQTTDRVKIALLTDNFKKNFLGKIEEDVGATELHIHKLDQDSLDATIIAELGSAAEITLLNFWELLKKQGSGQKGDLLTDGCANIAYIRDVSGELWAVSARWIADHDGWFVGARSVGYPRRWRAGSQVVSH